MTPRHGRHPRTWFRYVNQPLSAGVLIVLASTFIQHRYWVAQQRFLMDREDVTVMIETEEQVTGAVGKVLSASAIVVGAHERRFQTEQLNQVIDKYAELQLEWDKGEDLIKRRLRAHFFAPNVDHEWSLVLDTLGELDAAIDRLDSFGTADSSEPHRDQIARCRELITKTETALARLTRLMTDYRVKLKGR